MRERPILFNGDMVRALLAGQKTVTRRVVKPQPAHGCAYTMNGLHTQALHFAGDAWPSEGLPLLVPPTPRSTDHRLPCPYGAPGDRLWVRETIRHIGDGGSEYVADGAMTKADAWPWQREVLSSIHCPRGLSRITLEITDVRVERVRAITEEDARAEGVGRGAWPEDCTEDDAALNEECGYFPPLSHAAEFAALWDSINAKRGCGWDANPWVWVIEFKAVTP